MISSMTGYGSAEWKRDNERVLVEVKTVNGRFLKIGLNTSESLLFMESRIDAIVKHHITRGTISLSIRLETDRPLDLASIDVRALEIYSEQLSELGARLELPPIKSLGDLLALPGVVREANGVPLEQELQDVVCSVVEEAMTGVVATRRDEGVHLEQILGTRAGDITAALERVDQRARAIPLAQRTKLGSRLQAMLGDETPVVDSTSLERELAIMADRADVTEEIERLRAHLFRFTGLLSAENDGGVGRELDFLAQEMLREANTIASKSVDREMTHEVVSIKAEIERLKEQLQNVE